MIKFIQKSNAIEKNARDKTACFYIFPQQLQEFLYYV